MELSNYQAFMECMRKWEKIGCNILCGLALWEQMQKIADHCVRIMEDYRKGIGKQKESDCR